MTFQQLNIAEPILRALAQAGYESPTPIQKQAIPPLLTGRDLLGCAQTGTGKTAAFAVPILQILSRKHPSAGRRVIRALVLTPTRELAAQIGDSFTAYGANLGLVSTVIFGGVSQIPQVQQMKNGVDILVATPGRLLDLIGQKLVDIAHVELFVLDEADRMLDMGFLHDVERIIALLPSKRQTMLFSATMPPEIERLTRTILTDPVKAAVTPVSSPVDAIEQRVYRVDKQDKIRLLVHLLRDQRVDSALVFSRTKHGANKIAKALAAAGIEAGVIHSNKSQSARLLALESFKLRRSRVLVATDIVARGIDILELSHVVNFDLPEVAEAYIHRIGRTGRAGLGGTAISFCDASEQKLLREIEKLMGRIIPEETDHPYPASRLADSSPEAGLQTGRRLPGAGGGKEGRRIAAGQSAPGGMKQTGSNPYSRPENPARTRRSSGKARNRRREGQSAETENRNRP